MSARYRRAVRTAAVLPIKSLDSAKQRLGDALGSGSRRALATAMAADVLIALRRAGNVDAVLAVTGDPTAQAIAIGQDAIVLDDPDESGQSAAAALGIARALELGYERVLLVASDCPALDPAEVDGLLARHGGTPGVVVVPDRHGTGTNALLLHPPDAIELGFGEGSFERHVARARDAGVECAVEHTASLVLDVDTGDDLAALRAALTGMRGGAANTRGMLGRLGGTDPSAPTAPVAPAAPDPG